MICQPIELSRKFSVDEPPIPPRVSKVARESSSVSWRMICAAGTSRTVPCAFSRYTGALALERRSLFFMGRFLDAKTRHLPVEFNAVPVKL